MCSHVIKKLADLQQLNQFILDPDHYGIPLTDNGSFSPDMMLKSELGSIVAAADMEKVGRSSYASLSDCC